MLDNVSGQFILNIDTEMDDSLAQMAVSAAIAGDWEKAVLLNLKILKEYSKDVNALNRLARAYAEIGEAEKAQKYAKRVLRIDPHNNIACKCLNKWKNLKPGQNGKSKLAAPYAFLEEPGKTKVTTLIHLGDWANIAKLDPGEKVEPACHAHTVSITTIDSLYIGKVSDDLASKIIRLIKSGGEIEAYIKSVDDADVKIFLRSFKIWL